MNPSRGERDNEPAVPEAIKRLVLAAREKFMVELPTEEFDAPAWQVGSLRQRADKGWGLRLLFVGLEPSKVPLPTHYAEVIKSWLILERRSLSSWQDKLFAARILWQAILLRRNGQPEAFQWEYLCCEDLTQAEHLMEARWAPSQVYNKGKQLLVLVDFLAARGICRPLYFTPQATRPQAIYRYCLVGQEASRAKLPSSRALEGLADIYRIHATEPPDRLRIAALAILVVTGFRIGELLTLPEDCEIEEVRRGKSRYGLRFYKEKARSPERLCEVRWLTPVGAELARKAIADIRDITVEARQRARILEQNPERVPLQGVTWAERMSPKEVTKLLRLKTRAMVYKIPPAKLPRHGQKRASFFLSSEVEAYLRAERVQYLWTVDRRDGTFQMLSETLLIAPKHFFHMSYNPNPLLIEPVTQDQISSFLVSEGNHKSAFERFGIRKADGSFCRMTSHQIRHWLNDLADRGGLPVDVLTRWMGREYPRDTEVYLHATLEERRQRVKEGIRQGEVCGPMADVYFQLPEEERDLFLEGQIQAVHVTAMGLCIHDFHVEPCPYHLNCLLGCQEYLRVKGSQRERSHLIQIQKRTQRVLEMAQKEADDGQKEIAEPWVRHHQQTLVGTVAALAIDDAPSPADGTIVQPFQDQPSRFQPYSG